MSYFKLAVANWLERKEGVDYGTYVVDSVEQEHHQGGCETCWYEYDELTITYRKLSEPDVKLTFSSIIDVADFIKELSGE